MGVIQIRVDEDIKKAASDIFNNLGIDLSTAIRIFLYRCISEGGLPFEMKITETQLHALEAIKEMQTVSLLNGNSNMTLEEINEEIRLAREEKEQKNEKSIRRN